MDRQERLAIMEVFGESTMTTILLDHQQGYANVLNEKRIVSWWDMLQIDTTNFLSSLTLISSALGEYQILYGMASKLGNYRPTQPIETRALVIRGIADLQEECARHGLEMSEKFAVTAKNECSNALAGENWSHPHNLRTVTAALEQLIKVTVTEAESRQFYVLSSNIDEKHDDADTLFGADVVDAFPHAAFDISEAGKCLSFGLWTACVMHTMRVIESGIDFLALHVGVKKSENWNTTLNAIEKTLNAFEHALRDINKNTHGQDAAQSAAEAGTHLRFIKNAWRNQAMHQISKYDEREAKEVFENARSFMTHMAEMANTNR